MSTTAIVSHSSIRPETPVVFARFIVTAFGMETVPIIAMTIRNSDFVRALDEELTVIASEMLNGLPVVL